MAGIRVVRGPDWDKRNLDGGEGHLGTIKTVNDDKTADVVWDNGEKTRCNTGKDGKYELLIFDNASIGVRHTEVTCDVCEERGIFGMRWKCSTCKKCDLCPVCYMKGKHDVAHEFLRFTTPTSERVKVGERSTCQQIQATGIFPGATVVRGPDWKWGNQDGGAGSEGKVVAIENYGHDSSVRNAARVKWNNGGIYSYRVGAGGNMDLKCVKYSPGIFYFKDHLPRVDDTCKGKMMTETEAGMIREGDVVYIKVSADVLRAKQSEKATWTNNMSECIGKTGIVKSFTPSGDAVVEFDGLRFTFFHGVLQKVHAVAVGDVVRISADEETVKNLQKSCGGWVMTMRQVLGKCGKVVKIDSQKGMAVSFGEKTFVLNPACCSPAPGNKVDDVVSGVSGVSGGSGGSTSGSGSSSDSPRSDAEGLKDFQTDLLAMLSKLLVKTHVSADSDMLYIAIVRGDVDVVRSIVKKQPELINKKHRDVTPLIIASREGQLEIMKILLDNKARLEDADDKGNTALCYALNMEKEKAAKLLLEKGAKVNVVNNNGRTPLHFAAYDNLPDIIVLLIKNRCPVNAQDNDGDTALHDAIQKGHRSCVDVICRARDLDLTLPNKRGFNPLMLAVLRDNSYAVERILQRESSIANIQKKEDKFAAVHIAAVNNHVDCARLLIEKGNASLDVRNVNGLTALHLACIEAYFETVVLLVKKGANVNTQDSNGCTPLHLAVAGRKHGGLDLMAALLGQRSFEDDEKRVRIACFLIENGASYDIRNVIGHTPLDDAANEKIRQSVKMYIASRQRSAPSSSSSSSSTLEAHAELSHLLRLPCARCMSSMSVITTKPCDHKVLCRECCLQVDRCPLCHKYIERRIASSREELDCVIQ